MLLRRVLFAGVPEPGVAVSVNLDTKNLSASVDDPDDAVCGIRVLSDGTLQTRQGTTSAAWATDSNEWALPRISGVGSTYEVRLLTSSGTTPSGPSGWVSIGSTRSWELTRTTAGDSDFSGTLQIRKSGSIVDSAAVTMDCSVSATTILLETKSIVAILSSPFTNASAAVRLLSDGTLQTRQFQITSPYTSDSNEWALPRSASNGALYEARMVKTSGTNPTGALNTWLPLTSTRTWDLQQLSLGSSTFEGTLSIRANGGSIIDSAPIFLSATLENFGG